MTVPSGAEAAADLRVVDLDFRTDPRWDEFVCSHPDGLVFRHSAWLRALEREYGSLFLALACEDAARRIQGVLPLALTRGLPFGLGGTGTRRRLSSLPRTALAGPVAASRAALAALAAAAVGRTRAEPGLLLQLKLIPSLARGRLCSLT